MSEKDNIRNKAIAIHNKIWNKNKYDGSTENSLLIYNGDDNNLIEFHKRNIRLRPIVNELELKIGTGNVVGFQDNGDVLILDTDNNNVYSGNIRLPELYVDLIHNKSNYIDHYVDMSDYYHRLSDEMNPVLPLDNNNIVTLTNAGSSTGAKVDPLWFTLLADAGAKYGLSPEESIGLSLAETTMGNPTYTPKFLKLLSKKKREEEIARMKEMGIDPNKSVLRIGGFINDINEGRDIRLNELVNDWDAYYEGDPYSDTLWNLDKLGIVDDELNQRLGDSYRYDRKRELKYLKLPVLEHAYKTYTEGRYNKGQEEHTLKVINKGNELLTSPEYQKWLSEYNSRLKSEGGNLFAEGNPENETDYPYDDTKIVKQITPIEDLSIDDEGNVTNKNTGFNGSVVLPNVNVTNKGNYKSAFDGNGAVEFAGTVLNSPLMLGDLAYNRFIQAGKGEGLNEENPYNNGTPLQTTALRVGETFSPTRWIGTVKSGFTENPWSENNPGLWGDPNLDIMTDIIFGGKAGEATMSTLGKATDLTIPEVIHKTKTAIYSPKGLEITSKIANSYLGKKALDYVDGKTINGHTINTGKPEKINHKVPLRFTVTEDIINGRKANVEKVKSDIEYLKQVIAREPDAAKLFGIYDSLRELEETDLPEALKSYDYVKNNLGDNIPMDDGTMTTLTDDNHTIRALKGLSLATTGETYKDMVDYSPKENGLEVSSRIYKSIKDNATPINVDPKQGEVNPLVSLALRLYYYLTEPIYNESRNAFPNRITEEFVPWDPSWTEDISPNPFPDGSTYNRPLNIPMYSADLSGFGIKGFSTGGATYFSLNLLNTPEGPYGFVPVFAHENGHEMLAGIKSEPNAWFKKPINVKGVPYNGMLTALEIEKLLKAYPVDLTLLDPSIEGDADMLEYYTGSRDAYVPYDSNQRPSSINNIVESRIKNISPEEERILNEAHSDNAGIRSRIALDYNEYDLLKLKDIIRDMDLGTFFEYYKEVSGYANDRIKTLLQMDPEARKAALLAAKEAVIEIAQSTPNNTNNPYGGNMFNDVYTAAEGGNLFGGDNKSLIKSDNKRDLSLVNEGYGDDVANDTNNENIKYRYDIYDEKGNLWWPTSDDNGNVFYRNDFAIAPADSITLDNLEVIGDNDRGFHTFMQNAFDNIFGKKDSYKNSTEDFNYSTDPNRSLPDHERDNVINVHNNVEGLRDRLGMLGMVKDPETGGYFYRNPKYKGNVTQDELDKASWDLFIGNEVDENVYKYIRWCAENANLVNRSMGKPTAGDAWTRHGIYGDSAILVNPDVSKKGRMFIRNINPVNRKNASFVEDNIDNATLLSGDIVDLAHRGSGYEGVAWDEGDYNRSNSHTGTILKTGPRKDLTYVLHYGGSNKGMIAEPIGKMIGPSLFKENYITGIRRPGTKNTLMLMKKEILYITKDPMVVICFHNEK